MKKISLIILLSMYPIMAFSSIDERKIDVYFANGINTEEFEAYNNAELILKPAIIDKTYNGNLLEFNNNIGKVDYAYNNTNGTVLDLWESIAQKLNFQELLDAIFDTSHGRDLEKQIGKYNTSIKNGHRVLVVAHSQGNLFTAKALGGLDNWMRDYFYAVSVASPRAFKIKSDTPHIAFDNDIVPWLGGVYTSTDNPNGEAGSLESHAFTYYMGLPSENSNLSTNVAKDKIMSAVGSGISNLAKVPSQWVVAYEDDTTEVCEERRATLEHFRSAVAPIDAAYPFNTVDGKVYQIGEEYVLASVDGTKILNVQTDVDDKCYELEGTANPDVISIENICLSSMFNAKAGILESSLSWKSPEIDLDLSVSFGGAYIGTLDIQSSDGLCPNEHWYIATENEVQEGTYVVSIKNSTTTSIDPSFFPQTISFSVSSPGGGVEFSLDIANIEDLNMGAVAKVTVTKKTSGGGISVTVEATEVIRLNPTVKAGVYVTTAEGTRYDYKTESLLNQVKFGPIAGAIFEVSQFVDSKGVIYSGTTSSGNSIEDNGLMLFPSLLKDAVDDDNLYLITARGGQDVDANDDFVMDDVATTNHGKIHAIVSGADIKEGSLKVNIMTEVAYQVLSKSSENNITKIKMALDKISQKLFSVDINSDKVINRADLHAWLPGFDKSKLLMNYNEMIEPIVQKVYANEDIYLDVDKLIVPLVADAGEDMFIGVAPTLKLDGSKSYDINGNIVEYSWMEGGRLLCSSDKPICEIDMLSVGKHFITLMVSDNDGNTQDDTLNITINSYAPTANAGADQEIFQDSTITLDGSNSYDSNGKIVEYLWTSQNFVICQGSSPVCVIENLRVSDYIFFLTVTDDEGFSGKDSVNIVYPYKPVAEAGNDVSISFGTSVTLDGSKSYDNDGYIVKYRWEGSDEIYCEGTESSCTIEGLRSGTHLFRLIVTDDYGTTGYDFVEVKVVSQPHTTVTMTQAQKDTLLFIYQKEKVARDTYITLGKLYPNQSTFATIQGSEQTHIDKAQGLCETYGVDISNVDESNVGEFVVPVLQELYDTLVAQGSQSELSALKVGEYVEITDMDDLEHAEIGMPSDVVTVYENLKAGSYSHLDAFRSAISKY